MATRQASIKLSLSSGAFNAEMRGLIGKVGAAGRAMGTSLSKPLSAGFERAKSSLSAFGGELKSHLKTAATLGGALSFGAAIKSAIDAKSEYIRIANTMSIINERSVETVDVQNAIETAANRTKTSIGELVVLANQFAALSPDQMEEGLARASLQARRLGVESSIVARTYTRLIAKGVATSVEEAERLTEEMNRFGRTVLGIDPDEAIDPTDVAEYAAFVRSTNSSISEMNALLSRSGSTAKDLGQAIEIVEELGLVLQTSKGIKELRKGLHLSRKDVNLEQTAIENMFMVLEKKGPKGFKTLQSLLGTERAKKAIQEIMGEDIVIKAETGKVTKKEWMLRVGELKAELGKAKDAVFDWKTINDANKAITNTAHANLQAALNKITMAFAKPEMIKSIERLAENLPIFAEKLVELIDWVTENPWKAAGVAAGAKIGMPAVTTAVGVGLGATLKGVGTKLLATGAAAATAAKGALTAGGAAKGAAAAVGIAAKGAAATVAKGALMAGGAAKGAATAAGIAAKGAAAPVLAAGAAGAAVGYAGYKLAVEPALEAMSKTTRSIDELLMDADQQLKSRYKKAESLSAVLGRVREMKTETEPTAFGKVMNLMAGAFGAEMEAVEKVRADRARKTKLIEAELKLIQALKELDSGAGMAAGTLKKIGGAVAATPGAAQAGRSRGVRKPANSMPGAAQGG